MREGCVLFCEKCKKKNDYLEGEKRKCKYCENIISLEKRVERLVIVLNQKGFITEKSCEGHQDGFDTERRSYPWVSFIDESMENISFIEEVIGKCLVVKWCFSIKETTLGVRYILKPEKEKGEDLQEAADNLADFLCNYSYRG